jgi:hypothetical protein
MAKKPDSLLSDSLLDEQRQTIPRAARRKLQDAGPAPPAEAAGREAIVPSTAQQSERNAADIADPRTEPHETNLPERANLRASSLAPRAEPRNHRELAEAIFAECDPVKIGRELLESGNDKGASVRARVFETLADWQFGQKPVSSTPARPRVRFIWTIPGPPRESEVPPEPEPPENE